MSFRILKDDVLFDAFDDEEGSGIFDDAAALEDEGSDILGRSEAPIDTIEDVHHHVEELLESA